jgi:4-hydroxybenzoate polyprenyltransferase
MTATLSSFAQLMRPKHWLKNLLLLFPPLFAGTIASSDVALMVLPALAAFSMASSCTYIVNDIVDRQADRNHATKKNRAIARGDVKIWYAAVLAGVLCVVALLIASALSERFLAFLIIYLFISVFYSFYFKHIVLIDIFALSAGYILRVMAGGEAFHTAISSWLFLTVFIVSLFLASGKRLAELITFGENAHKHRKSLTHYSLSYLEGILWFSSAAALVTYALYTLERQNALLYTVPLVAFGLLRYIYIVKQGTGDPTDALVGDKQIMLTGIVWVMMITITIYK